MNCGKSKFLVFSYCRLLLHLTYLFNSSAILLQILIFENLSIFEVISEEITETLLTMMSDVQMEVIG